MEKGKENTYMLVNLLVKKNISNNSTVDWEWE